MDSFPSRLFGKSLCTIVDELLVEGRSRRDSSREYSDQVREAYS